MIRIVRKRGKYIAASLVVLMLAQILQMPCAYALTSGPTQPEVQAFQAAGTTDMVDLFTGDFSYNIPLFELPGPNGGYPFNLSYQSGVGMDTEASWVGLGFSLNPGAINRQMRGLPDEFKADPIYTKMAVEPSVTVGLGVGVSLEIFGGSPELGSIGLGASYNNFKGLGYSIDASLGFKGTASSGMTGGIGLDVSLNSKEGVNVNPSLSLGGKMGEFGLSAGYNSKSGLSSVSLSHSYSKEAKGQDKEKKEKTFKTGTSVSSSLTLAHPGYTPQVSLPMRNISISAQFKPGGSWWGLFANGYIKGFYSEQWLHNNKKRIRTDAYGYMNYQDAQQNAGAVWDMNREKDGLVTKESPNLAIPSQTYDIYSVTGQGISAMYRPMRNDYGILHDPETSSVSVGGAIGVDVGPAASHIGVNLSVNHSKSVSGGWTGSNDIASRASFQQKNLNDLYEPWYFKVHGELASENAAAIANLGGNDAVRVRLTGSNISANASAVLENKKWNRTAPSTTSENRERKPRSQVIQTVTNQQLLAGTQEIISWFKVRYLNAAGTETDYSRSGLPGHHIAGFTALTTEGLRYNYAIPAYNLAQEEVTFSAKKQTGQTSKVDVGNNGQTDPHYDHSDTEKFLKKIEMPPYAHSYLLTSIIGPDYVDVTQNGVTEDDLGYWVKFTYTRTAAQGSAFKWRDPFAKAHYQQGWQTDPRDDKGSFTYGEKEVWYLSKAETKSHIATFTLQEREDARGVAAKLQDNNNTGKALHALKEIKLFTRSAGTSYPIKVVRFEYDYSLCPGVYNSNTGRGKLTLKKVWFEYGNSQRGKLNPYSFAYHDNNPAYDQHAYDRWGNYKSYPAGDYMHNIDFPYADQNPLNKEQIDRNASAWSLREIKLPSGGKIIVDYESDDYAYVQHLQAMQMTEIIDPYTTSTQASATAPFQLRNNDMKVRFKLEKALAGTLTAAQQQSEINKYLDQKRKQLYFKIKVNLRSAGEGFYEYISGYTDIDFSKPPGLEKDASGNFAYGYFYVTAEDGNNPFSMRAWQHLRTNQPELANSGRKLKQTNSTGERVDQIKSLGSVFTQVRQMFEGFYNYCNNKNWGKEVIAGKSWIRLCSPDKIKYGGGLRVRQITMKDNWSEDEEGIYGQIYEYTTEENNVTISSGVAAYEPIVGGEENPLRYAKKYVQAIPLRSDNNLFFEFPVNESYYPGPQVGYSRVAVISLAAASLGGKDVKNVTLSDGQKLFPNGQNISYGTSGMTVNEFYTAKDFPVLTDETDKENKPYKLAVPIPFIGNIAISKLTTSQGYSIVTNDMHGKPRKMSTYRQDRTGAMEKDPISWVQYNYLTEQRIYQQEKVQALAGTFIENTDGTLSVASSTQAGDPNVTKYTLGQENEFFMDMRQYEDITWEGGARINTDIVYIPLLFVVVPIPVPTVWPSIGRSESTLRTAVTNKIIFKSGILESTEAYDGGSRAVTRNVKWDKLTGTPVLTTVNNNFDAPVYTFTVPAYTQYQGMGAAYQNIGATFVINALKQTPFKQDLYTFATGLPNGVLFPGDEIVLYSTTQNLVPVAKVVYTGDNTGEKILYTESPLLETEYQAIIVRSGYRNQLNPPAAAITALQDPSVKGIPVTHSKTITIPKGF